MGADWHTPCFTCKGGCGESLAKGYILTKTGLPVCKTPACKAWVEEGHLNDKVLVEEATVGRNKRRSVVPLGGHEIIEENKADLKTTRKKLSGFEDRRTEDQSPMSLFSQLVA